MDGLRRLRNVESPSAYFIHASERGIWYATLLNDSCSKLLCYYYYLMQDLFYQESAYICFFKGEN